MVELQVNVIRYEDDEIKLVTEHGLGEFRAVPRQGDIVIAPDGVSHFVEQVIHQFNGPTVILLMENEQ